MATRKLLRRKRKRNYLLRWSQKEWGGQNKGRRTKNKSREASQSSRHFKLNFQSFIEDGLDHLHKQHVREKGTKAPYLKAQQQ
ncbi:hypothetical protein Peur_008042 [Populus x canadensis]